MLSRGVFRIGRRGQSFEGYKRFLQKQITSFRDDRNNILSSFDDVEQLSLFFVVYVKQTSI